MLGDPTFTHEWNNAKWNFANVDNRDAFAANPGKYAPQFGGHCAVGKATGVSVKGSPKRWRIEDGKLFLNKNLAASAVHPALARRIHKL